MIEISKKYVIIQNKGEMVDLVKGKNIQNFNIEIIKNITLTQENIDDIMVAALEGGISYWANKAEVVGEFLGDYGSDQISRGGILKIYDTEDGTVNELTLEKFLKGFKMWVIKEYDHYGAVQEDGTVDCCEIDAECADGIIQCALFGDIIYS